MPGQEAKGFVGTDLVSRKMLETKVAPLHVPLVPTAPLLASQVGASSSSSLLAAFSSGFDGTGLNGTAVPSSPSRPNPLSPSLPSPARNKALLCSPAEGLGHLRDLPSGAVSWGSSPLRRGGRKVWKCWVQEESQDVTKSGGGGRGCHAQEIHSERPQGRWPRDDSAQVGGRGRISGCQADHRGRSWATD